MRKEAERGICGSVSREGRGGGGGCEGRTSGFVQGQFGD